MAGKTDDLQDRLDHHPSKVAKDRRQADEKTPTKRGSPKSFAETFHAICAEKIAPVLEKARTPCMKHGLASWVIPQYDRDPPSITFEIYLHGRSWLMFQASRNTHQIQVTRSLAHYRGLGEVVGWCGLNDLTPEIVQSQLDDFLSVLIRQPRDSDD